GKGEENARVRVGPREDRLLVVTNHEEVGVTSSQQLDHAILRQIEVLELVYQNVIEAPELCRTDRGIGSQQFLRQRNEIIEVHQLSALANRLVGIHTLP